MYIFISLIQIGQERKKSHVKTLEERKRKIENEAAAAARKEVLPMPSVEGTTIDRTETIEGAKRKRKVYINAPINYQPKIFIHGSLI